MCCGRWWGEGSAISALGRKRTSTSVVQNTIVHSMRNQLFMNRVGQCRMMRQKRLAFLIAFMPSLCWPLSSLYVRSMEVQFQIGGESLVAAERARVADFAHQIIDLGHCIESVSTTGSIELSERHKGGDRALAVRRAERIATLLRVNGIQSVGSSAPSGPPWVPNCEGASNACVQIEVVMQRRGSLMCP